MSKYPKSIRSTKIVKHLRHLGITHTVEESLIFGQRLIDADFIIPCINPSSDNPTATDTNATPGAFRHPLFENTKTLYKQVNQIFLLPAREDERDAILSSENILFHEPVRLQCAHCVQSAFIVISLAPLHSPAELVPSQSASALITEEDQKDPRKQAVVSSPTPSKTPNLPNSVLYLIRADHQRLRKKINLNNCWFTSVGDLAGSPPETEVDFKRKATLSRIMEDKADQPAQSSFIYLVSPSRTYRFVFTTEDSRVAMEKALMAASCPRKDVHVGLVAFF